MTRVEHHTEEDHAQMKREITDELRTDERRRRVHGCLIRLAIVIVAVSIPVIWTGSVVARTGLFTVPLLSSWLYAPAEPVRDVVPLVGSAPTDVLGTISARSRYDLSTGLVRTTASEQELTTLIRKSASGADDRTPFVLESAQIAIEDAHVEYSATTPRDGRDVPVIITAVPLAKDGVFDVEITRVVVGGYAVPNALVDAAFAMFGRSVLDSVRRGIDGLGVLLRVDLERGSVAITFQPRGPDDNSGTP